MTDGSLAGKAILVVEDEYIFATDLQQELAQRGVAVVGPVPSVEKAVALIASGARIDGAVLDVNLQGEMVFAVADLLLARSVPFLFTTGYDQAVIPPRFDTILRCEKPLEVGHLCKAVARMVAQG